MNSKIIEVIRGGVEGSFAGRIAFPEVVGKLMECGIESYRTDLYRRENTYYLPDGDSHVEPMPTLPDFAIASAFSAQGVHDAVQDSQQGKIRYVEFLRRIMEAGTTHYSVYLTGRCAVYVGRDGSEHVERFPTAL